MLRLLGLVVGLILNLEHFVDEELLGVKVLHSLGELVVSLLGVRVLLRETVDEGVHHHAAFALIDVLFVGFIQALEAFDGFRSEQIRALGGERLARAP